ncbi:MAG: hypothetical protein GY788_15870 [bacterium]|nr:hypothetical protein [bacterium]
MSDLDRIFRELSDLSMELADLPADAYDERARIEGRREALHAEAAALRDSIGDARPASEIRIELESLQARLAGITGSEIDVVRQHGGSGLESSGASHSSALNRQIEEAQGADELRSRIKHLERVLADKEAN